MLLWGASAEALQRKVRRARVLTIEVLGFHSCGSSGFRKRHLSGMASGPFLGEDDYLASADRALRGRWRE